MASRRAQISINHAEAEKILKSEAVIDEMYSLAEQIMEFCKTMQPGETGNLNLQIQVRRIAEEQSATAGDDNEFACKLSLVG